MKKYLMTGMAALALCAAFTSCSKETNLYSEEVIKENTVQDIINNYEAAFIKTFGQPAANQDWGFSDKSGTRATYDADHPGSYPNANMWADDGWKAPTELSPGQIARVKAYFQQNPHLTYVDPEYEDFFIQQVYKGNPATKGTISPEEYKYANDKTETGSEHMDHLTVGLTDDGNALDHIFNFNHGRYSSENANDPNGTPRDNVQNYPGVTYRNNNSDGKTHQDHIMLITQSNTKAVGFFESNGSVEHNYCCANASAQTIDEWALKEENWVNGAPIGETVYDAQWKRSFVGLDYEAKSPEAAYYKDGSNQKVEATLGVVTNRGQYAWDGEHYLLWSNIENQTLKDFFNLDYDVYFISDQTNGILAETSNYGGQGDLLIKRKGSQIGFEGLGAEQDYDVFDLTKISDKLDMGYIPVWGKGYVEWVTNIGGRDYVFSDWIVTLTEAKQTETEKKADLRIICEDLSAGDDGNDFDFNDVVIDVYYGEKDHAKAKILAAGGVLGLKVDGKEVHTEFSKANDNIDCAGKMINTNGTNSADANVRSKSLDGLTAPEITLSKEVKTLAQARDNIIIEVEKEVDGNVIWVKLEAVIGKVASKVRVGIDYQWKDERQYIGDEFKAFVNGTASADEWYQNQLDN